MKKTLLLTIAVALLSVFSGKAQNDQKISFFANRVPIVAQQKGISFGEAAAQIRAIGYSGVDAYTDMEAAQMKALKKAGFKVACAIARIDYFAGEQPALEEQALKFAKKNKCDKILLVPGFAPADCTPELRKAVSDRLAAFTAAAKAKGILVMVEDYDDVASPCYGSKNLAKVFNEVPEVGYLYDSGNFLPNGEDCTRPLEVFRNRISHVHVKDRVSQDDLTAPVPGTGCLPLKFVVRRLLLTGYDGWYTAEFGKSDDAFAALETAYNNIYTYLTDEVMKPRHSEYYYPRLKVVDPGEYKPSPIPADAKILFDGSNLDAWKWKKSAEGNPGWTINPDGSMTVREESGSLTTKEKFHSFQLHVEWRSPADIKSRGQGRGNSGIFMHHIYELQVLETYDNNTYVDGCAGTFYKQYMPLCNPCRKPGEWNVYDIVFISGEYDAYGNCVKLPRATVFFNGILVQNDVELWGNTQYVGFPEAPDNPITEGPISLQAHGSFEYPVSYQNIWIREL